MPLCCMIVYLHLVIRCSFMSFGVWPYWQSIQGKTGKGLFLLFQKCGNWADTWSVIILFSSINCYTRPLLMFFMLIPIHLMVKEILWHCCQSDSSLLHIGQIRVHVSRDFLELVEKNVLCQRPSWRVDAAKVNTLCNAALLISDHSVFPRGNYHLLEPFKIISCACTMHG